MAENKTRFTDEQIDNEIDFICGDSTSFWETPGLAEIVRKNGYEIEDGESFCYIDLDEETRKEIKEQLFYTGIVEPFVED